MARATSSCPCRFAVDENRGVGRRNEFDLAKHFLQRAAFADKVT
jgi:hypothetical protein